MDSIMKYVIAFSESVKSYALSLVSERGTPAGGTTGQVLKKKSTADYDTEWGDSGSIAVDDEISGESENPVQNKVIKAALDLKANAVSLGNKLDKDQGVSRAGEFLIVGDDGKVTTQAFDTLEGGSY